jgi:hypothetical protein
MTVRGKIVALLLLAATSAFAQENGVFHVKSIHKETPEEHGGNKEALVRYLKVIGTFNGKTYTIEAIDAGWNEVVEVGKDYPAVIKKSRMTGTTLQLESTWKNKPQKNSWNILTVEE